MPEAPGGDAEAAVSTRKARRPRRRPLLAAVLAVVVGVGGGMWWWSSRDPLKLPASACWSLVDQSDLRALAGDSGGTYTVSYSSDGRDDDGSRFTPGVRTQMCVVKGNHRELLDIRVQAMTEAVFHEQYERGHRPVGRGSEKQLDLGPDLKTWASVDAIRLAFRCDNLVTRDEGLVGVEFTLEEDGRITDARKPSVQQARLDIVLRAAKESAERALPCLNTVKFPERATAPAF